MNRQIGEAWGGSRGHGYEKVMFWWRRWADGRTERKTCWSFSYFLKKSLLGGEPKCGEQWRSRRAIWRQRIKQGEVIPNTELGEGCWSKCHLLAKFANIDPIFENSRLVTLRLIKCPFTWYLPLWTGCGKRRIVHEFNLQRFFSLSLFLVLK